MSAHKFEGPKGVGALYLRHGTHILAQQQGGSQERHRRGGTENVAAAVGMATAFKLACADRAETSRRLRRLRERLQRAVLAVEGTELTGHPKERLPGHLSLIARDTDGTAIARVLQNPLARATFLRHALLALPPFVLTGATWFSLALELLYAPLDVRARVGGRPENDERSDRMKTETGNLPPRAAQDRHRAGERAAPVVRRKLIMLKNGAKKMKINDEQNRQAF